MRFVLSVLGVLLVAAVFAPTARAQGTIPYRRTIPYLRNDQHEFTGRYVRLNVTFSKPGFGGAGISMGVQPTINPGVGYGPVSNAASSVAGGNGGADVGGGAGVGVGRAALRAPPLRTAGFGSSFRFSR
jgi:hypothetical protein